MARKATVLTIFVSCPSDLSPEKKAILNVVDEVNRTLRASQEIQFEVWDWARDAMPGIAGTSQEQIDKQIPEHDVYLGMMWKRFGAPTEGSGSGTEHEFNNSRKSHLEKRQPSHVIFAFKTAIDSLAELDAAEFAKIDSFKKRLADDGLLYIPFKSQVELEKVLQMNLIKIALSWKPEESAPSDTHKETQPVTELTVVSDEDYADELGLLDLQETIEDSAREAGEQITSIGAALSDMGDSLRERTAELEAAKDEAGKVPVKIAKALINRAADDMERFARMARPMLDNAENNFARSLDAVLKLIALQGTTMTEEEKDELESLSDSLSELGESVLTADAQMLELATVVIGLPKLSVRFNKGRKQMLDFINSYSQMSASLRSSIKNTQNLIKQH